MKTTVSTVIDRPIAGVWRWYAIEHVRNHPRWDPDMELEQISEGPIGLGTTFESLGPGTTRLSVEADYPNLDESIRRGTLARGRGRQSGTRQPARDF